MSYDFEAELDERYLVETLVDLLQEDCSVSLGYETLMDPDHPKLVRYVDEVLRPKLREIGVYDVVDLPKNQIGVKVGSGDVDRSLLLMAYTPVQHFNWMEDPHSGKVAIPDHPEIDEPCAYGQGASQNMGHFAALLALLKAFADAGTELDGTLYVVANNEGRSSHECSRALLRELDPRPDYGIALYGGDNQLWVSNRGRVDVLVHVDGQVAHSSTPEAGANAIRGANEVINRIYDMEFSERHPDLGSPHAIPYKVQYDPVAPHTIPDYARITVDRRLVPGDDVDEAVDEIRDAVGDVEGFEVEVERSVAMEPSVVDSDSPIVEGLQDAITAVDGAPTEEGHWPGAYDAGGPTNVGVPTVTWGFPDHNETLMGDDYVTLSGVRDEAAILGRLAVDMLTG